jgi:predicted AAA+ superfamily ATPase
VYLSLDDVLIRDQAQREPAALLARHERLTLDEVQRAPDVLLAVKKAVDDRRQPGRFVLTGSADLLLMKGISESLAGRAGYTTLWPLTRREQLGLGETGAWSRLMDVDPRNWREAVDGQAPEEDSWTELATRGGYPVPAHALETVEDRRDWFGGYVASYLERDLRQLSAVENLADLRRLMSALAHRIGRVFHQAEVARDLALPTSNVHRYINLLEVSYQLVRISPFAVNRTKRLIKSPKLYWTDTGLALFLAGEPPPSGNHLENLIATDLLAWSTLRTGPSSILYWRTASGAEVDFVIETPARVVPIEVKAAGRVSTGDARSLELFLDEYQDRSPAGVMLYTGAETYWLTRRVLAMPWWRMI